MRGTVSILITVLICVVVLALYFFLGRAQINKQINTAVTENEKLQAQLQDIDRKQRELPLLMRQLPAWKRELKLYKTAIPADIEDDNFLEHVADELEAQGIQLLVVDVVPSGAWLGTIGEAQAEELQKKGIDPEQAKQVKAADYTLTFNGDFKNVLTAFENMKKYGRLYTIDEVHGPAAQGGGMINVVLDPEQTPIEIVGRIYFGIDQSYLTDDDLTRVFASSVLKPLARRLQRAAVVEGQSLLGPAPDAATDSAEPDETGTDPANDDTDEQPVSEDSAANEPTLIGKNVIDAAWNKGDANGKPSGQEVDLT
ncbi:hypothetical protein JW859_14710 [bacterium]|nr:hypothetical protein [bacterium]